MVSLDFNVGATKGRSGCEEKGQKFLITCLYLGSLFSLSTAHQASAVAGVCKLKCLWFKLVIAEVLQAAMNCNGRNKLYFRFWVLLLKWLKYKSENSDYSFLKQKAEYGNVHIKVYSFVSQVLTWVLPVLEFCLAQYLLQYHRSQKECNFILRKYVSKLVYYVSKSSKSSALWLKAC